MKNPYSSTLVFGLLVVGCDVTPPVEVEDTAALEALFRQGDDNDFEVDISDLEEDFDDGDPLTCFQECTYTFFTNEFRDGSRQFQRVYIGHFWMCEEGSSCVYGRCEGTAWAPQFTGSGCSKD